MTVQGLKSRDQVEVKDTWDLTPMFADDAAFEASFKETEARLAAFATYQGRMDESAEVLADLFDLQLAADREVSQLIVYAHLKNDQDQTNSTYQTLYARAAQLASKLSEATAFITPELLAIPEDKVTAFIQENERLQQYQQLLDDTLRSRPHVLSEKEELLLAQASEIFRAPYQTFGMLNNADLEFPVVENEAGEPIQLTHSLYGKLIESTDRKVRESAFKALYKTYHQFKNTIASVLATNIKIDNFNAKVHNFESARAAALFANNVPESVYDTLLETVGSRLSLLHRYTALRKDLLKLEQLEMYDLYTPLLGEAPIKMTYDEAKKITLEALAPMGEEYLEIIRKAFDERWIDLYENKGKRSGAYSSGSYDSAPYILMNWQDNVNWLYTLVHELGHSAHSYLTRKYQPYAYGHYSIFLAEIASTTNENLLTSYLLEKYQAPHIRLYLLNHFLDGLKGTVFRQTQFAEFEHFMHVSDAEGIPLTQEFLSENYKQLNAKYYGEAVNSESEIMYEWARIPHFYYNYYVFQYATGFAAATAFASKILSGDQEALERYLGFLKSGCSEYPIDTMKRAGLDMTQRDYIEATLDVFEARLDEFETLLKQQ
ncbi:MAG: oligoendopeptidase F [Aerococcaceae bacterium]|nr:oligoendopeptidase F [Aerococcaceae bacterium]